MTTASQTKVLIDDAVTLLIDACETDDAYWAAMMTGQNSEEAESSGYLAGYRDCLDAMQRLVTHNDPEPLRQYLEAIEGIIADQRQEIEEMDA